MTHSLILRFYCISFLLCFVPLVDQLPAGVNEKSEGCPFRYTCVCVYVFDCLVYFRYFCYDDRSCASRIAFLLATTSLLDYTMCVV